MNPLTPLYWALTQAKENLGAYIGSPYESGYREKLKQAREALRCAKAVMSVFRDIETGTHEDYDNQDGQGPKPCACSQCCHRRDAIALRKKFNL